MLRKLNLISERTEVPDEESEWRKPTNPNLIDNLAMIRNAITEGKQIAFTYGMYDVDGQLKPIMGRNDLPKVYNASPYAILCNNNRHYLIASVNKHAEVSHYRIDRILSIRKRKTRIRQTVDPIDASSYIAEHPYMYSCTPCEHRLRVSRKHLNPLFDSFGSDIRFENTTETETDAIIRCDPDSLDFWLRRYGRNAKLIGEER